MEAHAESAIKPIMAQGRTQKVFEEEYNFVKQKIESAIAGEKSIVNPQYNEVKELSFA